MMKIQMCLLKQLQEEAVSTKLAHLNNHNKIKDQTIENIDLKSKHNQSLNKVYNNEHK